MKLTIIRTLLTMLMMATTLCASAQTSERMITVTENIAYRTDVGPSTVLDLAQPAFGLQQNRPAMDAFYARHLKHDDPTVSFEQLKGKQESRALFLEGNLAGYDQWTIVNKNFK